MENITESVKSFQCMPSPNCTGEFIANWTLEHCLPQSVKDIKHVSMSVLGKETTYLVLLQTFSFDDI